MRVGYGLHQVKSDLSPAPFCVRPPTTTPPQNEENKNKTGIVAQRYGGRCTINIKTSNRRGGGEHWRRAIETFESEQKVAGEGWRAENKQEGFAGPTPA